MSEEYEIIFITEEGRAIKNNKTRKIYHSEFEIIEEKNKQIKDLQQKVEQLEKENEKLKYLVDDSNIMKAFIVEHKKTEQLENIRKEAIEWVDHNQYYFPRPNDLLNILNKGSDK